MVPGRASFGAKNLSFTRCAKKSAAALSSIFPTHGNLLQVLRPLFTLLLGLYLAWGAVRSRPAAAPTGVGHGCENDACRCARAAWRG